MAEFLLEILAEEIPAGVLSQARNDLLRGLADALAAERIEGTFFAHSTSRRLVLFARRPARGPGRPARSRPSAPP